MAEGGAPIPPPFNPSPDTPTVLDPYNQAWDRLISCSAPQDELASLIETIYSSGKATDMVDRLRGDDIQAFINVTDEALNSLDLSPHIRGECVKSLRKMCARHTLVPKSLKIEWHDDPTGVLLYRGGFGDVWKRSYQGQEVAVKVLRTYATSDLKKIARSFCKEFVTWKALQHRNLLPLLGVRMAENEFAMVSVWMPNGNIKQFVATHKHENRYELLVDVARGLIYMHGQGMVHGDLKGANILIDETYHARLADFGLLTIISDSTTLDSYIEGGSTRWMGPELFDPEIQQHRPTICSDCYALGMVIYEVLSERVPFHKCSQWVVTTKVVNGGRPERPREEDSWFTDEVWEVLKRCWMHQPGDRPSIEDVLQCLEKVSGSWTPPSLPLVAGPPTRGSPASDTFNLSDEESTDSEGEAPPSPQPLGELSPEVKRKRSVSPPWRNVRPARFIDTTHPDIRRGIMSRLLGFPTRPDFRIVDQVVYQFLDARPGWTPRPPIDFKVEGMKGLKLTDAINLCFGGLDGHDDPMFVYDGVGDSFTCRMDFPGHCVSNYESGPIMTKDYNNHDPITRQRLACEVAKTIEAYLNAYPEKIEYPLLSFGVPFREMFLTRLHQVSRTSWQPEIWYQVYLPISS